MVIASRSPFLSIRKSKYQRDIASKMKQLWAKFPHSPILHYAYSLLLKENNSANNRLPLGLFALFSRSWIFSKSFFKPSKIYLEFDRFWRVWLRRTDKVSFKSPSLLDWNVMFTKVASIDKIELKYMAVVFIFCWVP